MQQFNIPSAVVGRVAEERVPEERVPEERIPEARYAYYRRCQVFRKGGDQCKAPAEKNSHICHAHAGQLATAVRRERERRAVLAEAVAQMRRRGKPECEMADLFMDFKGIQVTLAVMAQALIDGRIDCKTAGRLVVQLQTVSKLLRIVHRKGREGSKENQILPQICADDRGLDKEKASITKDTRSTPPSRAQGRSGQAMEHEAASEVRTERNGAASHLDANHLPANHLPANRLAANQGEETRIALVTRVRAFAERRGWGHAPPELLRAA
jgi:hypothetical protein